MRFHLVRKCTGDVPQEVRDQFKDFHVDLAKGEMVRNLSAKNRLKRFGYGSDDEQDSRSKGKKRPKVGGDKERAVNFISQLLELSETRTRFKPISSLTPEDFKKEERELNLKKLRLEVELLEHKQVLYQKFETLCDKVRVAVDEVTVNQFRCRSATRVTFMHMTTSASSKWSPY